MPLQDCLRFLTDPERVDGLFCENAAAAISKAGTRHETSEVFADVDFRLAGRDDWESTAESIAEALGAPFSRLPGRSAETL